MEILTICIFVLVVLKVCRISIHIESIDIELK